MELTLCILMDSSFWFDTINLGYHFKNFVLFCLKIFFTITYSVNPDEMLHYGGFHLGLHCL